MNSSCDSEKKSPGRGFSVTVAAVVVCLIFAALVWKTRQYTTPPALGAERAAERAKALMELRAAETDSLHTVAWIDQGKGVVRLPIEEAKKLAAQQWKNPVEARALLHDRAEKAFYVPPPPPPPKSEFE